MIALLWLVACGPRWSEASAVAPTVARLDTDHDGKVGKAEYDAVLHRGSPFEAVDTDADGALSSAELLALVEASDPLEVIAPEAGGRAARVGKDPKNARPKPGGGPGAHKGPPPGGKPADGGKAADGGVPGGKGEGPAIDAAALRSEAQLIVKMILESLRDEVRAASPGYHALPTDDDIKRAAGSGDIRTAESRALLLRIETAADAVGAGFPAKLRAATLKDEPVVPSHDPVQLPPPGGPPRDGAPGGGAPGTRPSGAPSPAAAGPPLPQAGEGKE